MFCLPPGKFYQDIFPPATLRNAPKINGVSNCCRCQVSGICVETCDRKATHIQLQGEQKKQFAQFFNAAVQEHETTDPNQNNN